MKSARTNIKVSSASDATHRGRRVQAARERGRKSDALVCSAPIIPPLAGARTAQRVLTVPMRWRMWVLLLPLLMKCLFSHAQATNTPAQEETNAPAPRETNAPAPRKTNSRALRETNAPTRLATNAPALDYSSFKIIADRNIFNPNRSARSARGGKTPRKQVKSETISLVGTLCSENGNLAFFDSSSSQYKKVLKPGGTIAGFTIKHIAPNYVTLESGGKVSELRVGMRIRREDEGEWRVSGQTESLASSTNQTATPADAAGSASDDEDNDVLKKLLQKREEELNK
jgi:hypothetical protein